MANSLTFIQPAAPVLSRDIPVGDGWLAEPKLDGYRIQIIKNGAAVRLFSRARNELTERLPTLVKALASIRARQAIIDAELVAIDAQGRVDFYGIPSTIKRRPDRLRLFTFDVMHLTRDIREEPLWRRQERLDALIERAGLECLQGVARHADGEALFKACSQMRLEGVVVKRVESVYRSGRCPSWLKIKCPAWVAANRDRFKRMRPAVPATSSFAR